MRVTHVIRSDGWAGVETHATRLALEQARSGHTVQLIGADPEAVASWVRQGELQHWPASTVLHCVRALNHGPRADIVHVHMSAAELAAALAVRIRGVPVVSTRHFASVRGARLVSRPVVRLARHRVSAQIAVSQFVADHIEGASTVILAGVESSGEGLAAADRDRVVLVVQRLQPEKNTHLALEAFAASALAPEGWRLDVVGTGPLRGRLEMLADALGVGDVVNFLGHRSDVTDLMARAGLLIAPRHDEAYGLSVVEAMAAGLPVVAAGAGGHLETVGRVPGAALFSPGDVEGAGLLLRELARDVGAREVYGRALRDRQREALSLSAQASATEAVYRSVL